MLARRYDDAITQLRATLALDGNFAYAHQTLGSVLFLKGDVNGAIAEYEKVKSLNADCDVLGLLGLAYAELGRTAEVMQILEELHRCAQKHYVRNHIYALIYIALGQKDTAIDYLEKSADNNWLRINPLLDPLRDQPRFQKLVAKLFPPQAP
jgi:tetratricopeptide (TPR) repeat protein